MVGHVSRQCWTLPGTLPAGLLSFLEKVVVTQTGFLDLVSAQEKRNLPLVVQKFGGSSVATAERIMAAARRALRAKQAGKRAGPLLRRLGDRLRPK